MRKTGLCLLIAPLLVLGAACDEQAAPGDPEQVSVRAEVIEADAPVDVEATQVGEDEDGLLAHGIRVTWRGEQAVRLDDARFAHQAERDDGALVTAGRGCGADWDEEREAVMHVCTDDLQIIVLEPGETHAYPIRIYAEVGPLRIAPGAYVIEEVIHWWDPGDFGVAPHQQTYEGQFTIRLTYEVR